MGVDKLDINSLKSEFSKYKKDLLDLNNMNDVKIAESKTLKKFEQDNFVYNILATLREKINAPTRNKK